MRHKKRGRKLGRTRSHYRALRRNLVTSLFRHERIITTREKAKEFAGFAEQLITRARKFSLHNYRQIVSFLQDKEITRKLFKEIAPRFKDRPGGYTRIIKLGGARFAEKDKAKWAFNRLGDDGARVILELVIKSEEKKEPAKGKKKKARTEKKG